MACQYIITPTKEYNTCALGLYGGKPSHGTCAHCVSLGENTPEFAGQVKATPPSLPQQAASLGKALVDWASSGFAPTPPDALAERMEICKACPEWDANGMGGTGRCKKCGCSTQVKLRMATEKCPLDKWGPVTPSFREPQQQQLSTD